MRRFTSVFFSLLLAIMLVGNGVVPAATPALAEGQLHHFALSPISNQMAGVPFPITITAKDSTNNTLTSYTGTNTLSDNTTTIVPTQTDNFTDGVWTGNVTINEPYVGNVITTSSGGIEGISNPFDINIGVPLWTVSGTVTDNTTDELLLGVDVDLYNPLEGKTYGCPPTNENGQYAITLPSGDYDLNANFFGYVPFTKQIVVSSNMTEDIALQPGAMPGGGLHHFMFSPIGNQMAGVPFPITITAKDSTNNIVTSYNGTNTLNDYTGTINPWNTGPFSNGVWTGNVTIYYSRYGNVITTSSGGIQSTSNSFEVGEPGQPTLSVEPDFVAVGGNVIFSVSQFTPGESVQVLWDGGPLYGTQLAGGVISGEGTWTSNPVTITGMYGGDFWVKAISPSNVAYLMITVINADAGPDYKVDLYPNYLSLAPSGSANVTVTIKSINNFSSNVTFSAYPPGGVSCNFTPASVAPPANGQISAKMTVTVESWVGPQMYYIGIDCESQDPHIFQYRDLMLDIVQPNWGPSISLSQSYGQAGDVITITGSSFTGSVGKVVTIREIYTNTTIVNTNPATIVVASGGTFNAQVTVPDVPSGNYRLEARVNVTGEFAEKNFQIMGAQSSFSMSASPWSTSVVTETGKNSSTVNINLFSIGSSNTTVELYIQNRPTWLTYRFGSLTENTPATGGGAIAIPIGGSKSVSLSLTAGLSAPTGNYFITVRAEDVTTYESQFVDIEYIVMPPASYGMAGITLNPNIGEVGDTVFVSGWGFTPGSDILELKFAREDVLTETVSVSADGSFSARFTVPSQVFAYPTGPGMYPFDVMDSNGVWGGAEFMVIEAGQEFSLSTSPNWLPPIPLNGSDFTTIWVKSIGAGVTVALSMERLPYGIDYIFSQTSVTVPPGGQATSTLTLTPRNIPPGHYSADIKGDDGTGHQFYTHVEFDVTGGTDFQFPEITLNPMRGKPGTKVTIMGTGFTPSDNITHLWFSGVEQSIPVGTIVDTNGIFTLVFTVPNTIWGGATPSGWYLIDVESEHDYASNNFEVTSADVVFTMMAEPNWLPPIPPNGNGFTTIWVQSMGAGATVSLSVEKIPPGVNWNFSPTSVTVPPGGKVASTLTLTPTNIPPGHYMAEVKGVDGNSNVFFAHLEFEVKPPEGFIFPEITINPNIGPAGTKVTVVGTDFPSGANVTSLRFAGMELTIPTVTADVNGDFTLVFNIPKTLWGGPTGWGWYDVGVEAQKPGEPPVFIMKNFEVTAADVAFTMRADPNWLPPIPPNGSGSTTIWVQSMGAGATVSLSVEKIPPGINWNFSPTSVTVPPGGQATSTLTLTPANIPQGHYMAEVKGVDGNSNIFFAHLEFEVAPPLGFMAWDPMTMMTQMGMGMDDKYLFYFPEITLNPNIGPAGTKVTISATDFPSGANVTSLRFAGMELTIPTVTADVNGDFTLVFNIPKTLWGGPTGWGWYDIGVEAQKPGEPPVFIMKNFEVTAADVAFTMRADPNWLPPIPPSGSGSTTIWVQSMGAGATVSLSVEKIPPGINWNFSPTSVTVPPGGQATSTLTLTPANIPQGHYMAEVKGVDGNSNVFFAHLEFEVKPPEGFMAWNPMTMMTQMGMGMDDKYLFYFPEITLNPNIGPAGTKVTISATDFPSGANVTSLRFAGMPLPIPPVSADENGDFTLVFNVPKTLWGGPTPSGWYDVGVEAQKPGEPPVFIMKNFEVTAADVAFTMRADPNWLPPIPPNGSGSTTIWVQSMGAGATVSLSVEKIPPGINWNLSPTSVTVPPGGQATSTLTLTPANIPPGHYMAEVKGVDGNSNIFFAHLELEVAPPLGFMDKTWMQAHNVWFPEITLNPNIGPAGTKITISATDFPTGANVTSLRFAGMPLPIPPVSADDNGDFTLVFNVPKTYGVGHYMVEVEAGLEGMFPVFIAKPFEVMNSEQVSFNMKVVPEWVPGIEQGSSGNTAVFVESASKKVVVGLSVDGLPFGASAQFSPSNTLTVSPGGTGSVTLTITTSLSTPPGKYPLSIKGVSDNSTRDIKFGFAVKAPAAFQIPALTLDPDFAPAGYGDKKMKITFSGTGFPANKVVYLTFAGDNVTLPAGFSTDESGNFNGVFQLPTGLDSGTYMAEAIAGGRKDSKPFTIKASGSTFIIKPSPPFLPPIIQGASGSATVTVESVGTTSSTVTLSIDGLPAGVNAVFSPSNIVTAPPGSSTSATVTINVGASTLPERYPVSILGVNSNETNSMPFGFSVMTDIGDGKGHATITVNPPGGNPGTHITITGAGFTENETITLTAAPMGAQKAPFNITAGNIAVQVGGIWSSLFTIPQVDPGLYIVKATDGIVSAKTELHVAPAKAKAFTLNLSPSYLKIMRGHSGNVTLKVNSQNKFKDIIQFGVGGLPLGATLTFTDAKGNILGKYAGSPAGSVTTIVAADNVTPVPGESLTITVLLTVDDDTPLGQYFIPLEVSYNPTIVEVLNLQVTPPEASLLISPNSGAPDTDVSLSSLGFTDNETITITFGSDSIATIPSPLKTIAGGTFTGMITVPDVAEGIYAITATGATSDISVEAAFVVKPSAADTFVLSARPAQLAIPKDGKDSFTLTVEPSGSFNSEVSLALTGLDAVSGNATHAWTPASGNITSAIGTPVSVTIEITNLNDAEVGRYPLTVTATSGNITQTVNLRLKVIPATPDFSVTVAPAVVTMNAGTSGNTTVSVAAFNGFSGTVDLLLSPLPAGTSYSATGTSVTVSAATGTSMGSQTITFTIADNVTAGSYSANITGSSGALTHSAEVTIICVPAEATTSTTSSPLVDLTTIGKLAPLSITTSRGDVVTVFGIIPEAPEPLSVTTEDINTLPATLGTILVNYADGRGYVTNIDTSAPIAGATWQFKLSYDPAQLMTAGINPDRLNLAHLDPSTGEWVLEDTDVVLKLMPSAASVTTDSTFTVDIQVEAGDQQVSGVETHINFDTTYLSVDNVTANTSALPITLGDILIDNDKGQLAYSAGTLGTPPSGTFTIATIAFRGQAETEILPIFFNRAGTRFTDARYGAGSVLSAMVDTDNHITFTNLTDFSAWTLLGSLAEEVLVLRLVPSSDAIIRNSEFTVDIQLDAHGQVVSGASAFVNFDPTYMIVTDIMANKTTLPIVLDIAWNNVTGTANYSAGRLMAPYPTGTFTIANITFRCQQESDNATISFNMEGIRTTDVRYGTGSVLGAAIGCTIKQVYDAPLRLQPADTSGIVEGQEFTLALQVNAADNQSVSGTEVYINFEPAYLEVTGITADTSALPLEMPGTSYNNTSGQLQYAAGKLMAPYPTGTFTIANITFRAKEKVAETWVTISVAGSRKSLVRFETGGVYGAHTDARVGIIKEGAITITVSLQGSERTEAHLTVPFMVKLFDPSVTLDWSNIVTKMYGETSANFTTANFTSPNWQGVTGAGGITIANIVEATPEVPGEVTLQIEGVIPGTYKMTLTSPHNLINLRENVEVTVAGVLVDMKELQEGNGDDSFKIDITDFGLLADAFGSIEGGGTWDAKADYDNNLQINIADFTILAMNYGEESPVPVTD